MKSFSQKGQGFVEYALIVSLIAVFFLVVVINGGFRHAIIDSISGAGDNLNAANVSSSDSASDDETQTAEDTATPTYKTLNWQREINPFADMTYNTILNSDTVDKALSSEIGFFNTLFSAVEGYLASTNPADGTKDWESFLTMTDNIKARNNFQSTYVRDEQKITVKRAGNDLRITYSDKENIYYYKLAPDADNVLQVETNSNKSYSQFFSTVMDNADGGGWQYGS